MQLRHLRPIRIALAIVSVAVFSLVFLDVTTSLPAALVSTATALQLVPSVVKTLTRIGFWTAGAAAVLVITLLVGRVYCSTLCPLGTLQDVFIRLHRWNSHRRRYTYSKPRPLVQYGILCAVTLLALGGSMTALTVLEPFSAFGRMTAALARPAVVGLNNLVAWLGELGGTYGLARARLHAVGLATMLGSLAFLGFLGVMSMKSGRWFCTFLCPAGALLSLASRVSMFRIVIDETTCKACGLCEKVCKARCINSDAKAIDFSSCVGCYNCIDACPTVGLKFSSWFSSSPSAGGAPVDPQRRSVMIAGLLPLAGFVGGDTVAKVLSQGTSSRPVSPPGSVSAERFTGLCTACHLCVSACPTQVIAPSFLEYGIAGVFQPRMDYHTAYCNYECTICGMVCPTGALLPLSTDQKKQLQLGKAKFVRDDCIVITKKKDCGACSEHCPTKAVQMVPHEKTLMIPEVKEDVCVGCGACEHACPTVPRKAIYVEANAVHAVAKKPEIKKLEPVPVPATGDFPF